MLGALMLAIMPAAFGVLRNASFIPERPAPVTEQTSVPTAPQLERPDPKVDRRIRGKEDLDSQLTERRQAHNEGDD